jgi:hypothetical protein
MGQTSTHPVGVSTLMKMSSVKILSKSSSVFLNLVVDGWITVAFVDEKNKFDEGSANMSLRVALFAAGLTLCLEILQPEKENYSKRLFSLLLSP